MSLKTNQFSLLWPTPEAKQVKEGTGTFTAASILDIGIDELVRALSISERYRSSIKILLLQLCQDAETINYRLDILEDFLNTPALEQVFLELIPMVNELASFTIYKDVEQSPVFYTVKRLGELDLFVKCINYITPIMKEAGASIKSKGLHHLYDILIDLTEDEMFQSLTEELPKLRAGLESMASVTIGVNLDHNLKPVEATLVSINDEKFKGSPFLKKLFTNKLTGKDYNGISSLYRVEDIRLNNLQVIGDDMFLNKTQSREFYFWTQFKEMASGVSMALQVILFKDLQRILSIIVKPIESIVQNYTKINSRFLVDLGEEIVFYIGAARLIKGLRAAGVKMCRPQVGLMEERVTQIADFYNINLAILKCREAPEQDLSPAVITNDISFNSTGRIFIITGPNRGGKTTYIQGIALAQVLFQAGLFIPGESAYMTPVDGIYTHFPVEERLAEGAGRLGEESKRIGELFQKATCQSLVLLNESLSSTSSGEALYIARDIIRAFKTMGVRVVFATHMHDLAADLDILNNEVEGDSKVISIVSGIESSGRNYKFIAAPPMGKSYAKDIAHKYGISFEQLMQTIKERAL